MNNKYELPGIAGQFWYITLKFQFCELMTGVTFLCPNKKVTKEVGIGGGFFTKTPPPIYHPSETGKADGISTKLASVPTCGLPNCIAKSKYLGRAARAEPPP